MHDVAKLRQQLGWSQYDMAEELGVSQPTIWRIENGKQQPSRSVTKLIGILVQRVELSALGPLGGGRA